MESSPLKGDGIRSRLYMKAMDRADGVLASLSLGTCVRNVGSPVSCLFPEPSVLFFSWACAHGALHTVDSRKKKNTGGTAKQSWAFSIRNVCATFWEVTRQCSQPQLNLDCLHSKSGSVQGLLERSSDSTGQDSDLPFSSWPLSLG